MQVAYYYYYKLLQKGFRQKNVTLVSFHHSTHGRSKGPESFMLQLQKHSGEKLFYSSKVLVISAKLL